MRNGSLTRLLGLLAILVVAPTAAAQSDDWACAYSENCIVCAWLWDNDEQLCYYHYCHTEDGPVSVGDCIDLD